MALTYLHPATVSGYTYLAPVVPPATSVSAELAIAYAVRGAASSSLALSYVVRAAVFSDLLAQYAVGARASADLSAAYIVTGRVDANLGVSYSIRSQLSSDLALAYSAAVVPALPINPRMIYVPGRRTNFRPMRAAEAEVLTIDFGPALAKGETILSATWANTVSIGEDPNAAAMIGNRCTVTGTNVSEMFSHGVGGVTYAPTCTVTTSEGQTIVLPEYQFGLLYVSP